jgi:hypothetical protein
MRFCRELLSFLPRILSMISFLRKNRSNCVLYTLECSYTTVSHTEEFQLISYCEDKPEIKVAECAYRSCCLKLLVLLRMR